MPKTWISKLKRMINDNRVLSSQMDCFAYSRDMSVFMAEPEAIVIPKTVQEIQKVLQFANQNKIPVTPRGAGTSVTGAVIPIYGGILIDLSLMNKIKKINLVDRYAVVEPGVICQNLNQELAPIYFFPPDPGSLRVATIGGMISTNASGKSALKYGTTSEYVRALEVVLPTGQIINTGHRAPKSSFGFDLTRLFASAEGTLGIITEAVVRIVPTPEKIGLCLVGFETIGQAAVVAVDIIESGLPLRACELIDCVSIKEFSLNTGLNLGQIDGMLILEVDGPKSSIEDLLNKISDVCRKQGAKRVFTITDESMIEKIWQSRHMLISALNPYTPNARLIPLAEDIGVPVSQVPKAIKKTKQLSKKYNVPIILFGHAGDGNIHTTFVLNPKDMDSWQRAKAFADELNLLAIELDGTISAEHGIGLAKAPYIKKELGATYEIMKQVKRVLDPNEIMNPGKMGFIKEASDLDNHFVFNVPVKHPDQFMSLGDKGADIGSIQCMMCGACRMACPIFATTGIERDNARSKVQLSYMIRTGRVKNMEQLTRMFYLCTGCAACEQNCPSKINVTKMVQSARKHLFTKGLVPRSLNKFLEKKEDASQFDKTTPTVIPENDWLLYLGMSQDSFDDEILSAIDSIFSHAGVKYHINTVSEMDSGLNYWQMGDREEFIKTAQKLYANFSEKPFKIVTPNTHSLYAFNKLYPDMVPNWHTKVIGTIEWLNLLIHDEKLELNTPISKRLIYHDPCYLSRHLDIIEMPRKIIKSLPGRPQPLEFPQNREKTLCCGGGSLVPIYAPDIALKMAKRRLTDAIKLDAQLIVTSCPNCKVQFKLAQKELSDASQIHIIDFAQLIQMAI